ncbi:serine/threonine protein kinase [Moelleriella libera RCEF 2490]|uniref:Serine/threonine protein kinase n=1 Tax=Moelleriella libera RCEF 2490 TaxID=1081109 RepID=A0A168FBW9_9HYPO|nr:serine/threonine protein kinase [Moelleriella libera RCEF 2490]
MAAATIELGYADYSTGKKKAIEDARKTQSLITKECATNRRTPPPYVLTELIGKGSFGRVYKARRSDSSQLVSIKIISIEEGDSSFPGGTDTFKDILKEVNTLKLLNDKGAKNINCIIDTHLVGQSVWMITEYCAGGSVATLMRPTGGLAEKWIIPILREVAEAVHWVHKQGVIHRDIKCANVLITELGGVQLCDFGVAAIIETRFDKRSTVTGTLQWMAPELFDSSISYGIEVDIWAFGSMAYEVATGLPPNATGIINIATFGSYLKHHCPRLEGEYSPYLKDFIARCMVHDPEQRPPIEDVQKHPYIFDTCDIYPTAALSQLVNAYKLWEAQGGSRKSLFSAGGAQGRTNNSEQPSRDDEWNFGTLNDEIFEYNSAEAQAVRDAYGSQLNSPWQPTNQPTNQPVRRRPTNMKPLTVPLEQVFDPNLQTNYEDNARGFYGSHLLPKANDLPLRNDSDHSTVRESLIDLDASLVGNDLSQFVDMGTVRANTRSVPSELYQPTRRLTQDWKFPFSGSKSENLTGADFDDSRSFEFGTKDPVSDQAKVTSQSSRASTLSLIDLDASLPEGSATSPRPSTAGSDSESYTPFDLEEHVSDASSFIPTNREPSIYVSDGFGSTEPYVSDVYDDNHFNNQSVLTEAPVARPGFRTETCSSELSGVVVPLPPATGVMLGTSSHQEMKQELQRLVLSLGEHLQLTTDTLTSLHMGHST